METFLASAREARSFDAFAIPETHLRIHDLMNAEREVQNMGYKASFAPARQSAKSLSGSQGGTCIGVLSYHQSECFREKAITGTASDTTAGLMALPAGSTKHNFFDWVPMCWHLKGFSLIIVSLYLDSNGSLNGVNARKLTTLAAFLSSCQHPWIVMGDWNTSPEKLWASGWPTAMGGHIATIPDGYTCFTKNEKKGTTSESLIDYALVSYEAQTYFLGFVSIAVPWKTHIGQVLRIRGQAKPITVRQMKLPSHFHHPPAPKKKPDPNSKRQRKKQQKIINEQKAMIEEVSQPGVHDIDGEMSYRWEQLGKPIEPNSGHIVKHDMDTEDCDPMDGGDGYEMDPFDEPPDTLPLVEGSWVEAQGDLPPDPRDPITEGGPGNETAPSRFQTQALRGKPVREHELVTEGGPGNETAPSAARKTRSRT